METFDHGIKLNDIIVPLVDSKESEVNVHWKSCSTPIKAYKQGKAINKWITDFIGAKAEEFMLVRVAKSNYRSAEDYYKVSGIAADKSSKCDQMSGFQNYCSVLLSSEESLQALNAKYDETQQLTWFSELLFGFIIIRRVIASVERKI
eukprot:799191_1